MVQGMGIGKARGRPASLNRHPSSHPLPCPSPHPNSLGLLPAGHRIVVQLLHSARGVHEKVYDQTQLRQHRDQAEGGVEGQTAAHTCRPQQPKECCQDGKASNDPQTAASENKLLVVKF